MPKKPTKPLQRTINNSFIDATKKAAEQQEAAHRLAALMRALAEPPEAFLSLLERLEVPYIVNNLPFDESGQHDCVVIRMKDLVAGEERNQAQGSRLQRLYGEFKK